MPRKKRLRMAELAGLDNVLEYPACSRGRWREIFGNDRDIVLELAAGKGDYALALAELRPDRNYVATDKKGARLWVGATSALERNLPNVRFLRVMIERISRYFAPGEVTEIWITFPDPFPSKPNRRLVAPRFLAQYETILAPGGVVHLKTDDLALHEHAKDAARQEGWDIEIAVTDLYARPVRDPRLSIRTFYEKKHMAEGRRITYLRLSPPKSKRKNRPRAAMPTSETHASH